MKSLPTCIGVPTWQTPIFKGVGRSALNNYCIWDVHRMFRKTWVGGERRSIFFVQPSIVSVILVSQSLSSLGGAYGLPDVLFFYFFLCGGATCFSYDKWICTNHFDEYIWSCTFSNYIKYCYIKILIFFCIFC